MSSSRQSAESRARLRENPVENAEGVCQSSSGKYRPLMTDDETADGVSRHHCVDCGIASPETETNYTLISARYGWRLTRKIDASGCIQMEWRCPRCWEIFRRSQTG